MIERIFPSYIHFDEEVKPIDISFDKINLYGGNLNSILDKKTESNLRIHKIIDTNSKGRVPKYYETLII